METSIPSQEKNRLIRSFFFLGKIFRIFFDWTFPREPLPNLPVLTTPVLDISGRTALYPYRTSDVQKIIWALKYRGDARAIAQCARNLYDTIIGHLAEYMPWERNDSLPLLIPIPVTKNRLYERGFNQTVLLVEAIARLDNGQNFMVDLHVLYKKVSTKNQTAIKDKKERGRNLVGCFDIKDRMKIAGRTIIVIDDVTTTGSTFREASRVLKAAGARRVWCLAVAH